MSGVRVGSRLEQLEALERQVRQEIALERRRLASEGLNHPAAATPPPAARSKGTGSKNLAARLATLGVTAAQVKEWAAAAGLIEAPRPGPIRTSIIDAYVKAHPSA